MTEKNIEANSGKSYLILSIGVLIIGMFLFYYYSDVRLFYRVVGMITVLILSSFIAYQSDFGKLVYSYVTDSKVELKKVTWPTKRGDYANNIRSNICCYSRGHPFVAF